ncbi:MAG: hypothetical protein IT245_00375 [Bacteroidia bacterium]|nr:hypothetical protein [Bacteroidia bacterium]
MKSSKIIHYIFILLGLFQTIISQGQITPDKYYQPTFIRALGLDSCIITKVSKDNNRQKDMVIAYDRKGNKMTFKDQLNGSRIVFKYGKDSTLLVQEFFIKQNGKEEKAGMDSFFYDANGKKTRYHSIVLRKKGNIHITINYFYKSDSLYREEYLLDKAVLKSVIHTYDRRTNTEIMTVISDKEPSNSQFYQRDGKGNLIKFFVIELNGDTSLVHKYTYDSQGRNIETKTYDLRSNISNIYKTYFNSNGMIMKEEQFLNIQFGDISSAIYVLKEYQYWIANQILKER